MKSIPARIIYVFLYIFLIFYVFFYPTSQNGALMGSENTRQLFVYYGLALILAMLYVLMNSLDRKRSSRMLLACVYMVIATFISSSFVGGHFAVARLVYSLLPLIVLSVDVKAGLQKKFLLNIYELLTIVVILWNLGLMFQYSPIVEITNRLYSQFTIYTTNTFVSKGRPVFTFGVYSYGAFFYAGMFIIWESIINHSESTQKRYNIYVVILILFQLLLRGSTALLLGAMMLFFFLRSFGNSRYRYLTIPLFLAIGIYFIYTLDYDWSRLIIGNESNGFVSRYFSGMFRENFNAVKGTITGIGWTVIESMNIRYTDSGYIVLFTMGSVVFPIIVYTMLYETFKYNLPAQISKMCFVLYMLFEIALPGLLYPKAVIFTSFMIITIRNICDADTSYVENNHKHILMRF